MSCPQCGGLSRTALAPGYWRCTSLIEETHLAGVQTVGHMQQPVYRTSSRECGHAYQEGPTSASSDSPLCRCGTFAIGRCAICQSWCCGVHGGLLDETRLCDTHYRESRAAQLAQREAELEVQRQREERERRIAQLHDRTHGWEFFKSGAATAMLKDAGVPTVTLFMSQRHTVVKRNLFLHWFVRENLGTKYIEIEEWEPAGLAWVSAVRGDAGVRFGILISTFEPGGQTTRRWGLPTLMAVPDDTRAGGELRLTSGEVKLTQDELERLSIDVHQAAGHKGWPPGACPCDAQESL